MRQNDRSTTKRKTLKRPDPSEHIEEWDDYFLEIAITVARKSKDPKCPVGAVIVSPDRLVLATGFNGLARGVFDSDELLTNTSEKLKWICHAEINAIFNAVRTGVSVVGCTIYVNKFPCFACCNATAQAGIKRVCTFDHRYWDDDPADADHSRKRDLLKQAGVIVHAPLHPDFIPLRRFTATGTRNGDAEPTPERPADLPLGATLVNGHETTPPRPLAKAAGHNTTPRRPRRASSETA